MDDHDDGVKCGQGSNLSQCECDEMCKEPSLMCFVVQLSTSSLVFTLSCFLSRLLLYTLSS